MPYIGVNVTGTLTEAQKETLKTGFGEKITLIPGKTEKALMVDFSENHTMYFQGDKRALAFVDVRLYKNAAFEDKKRFTEAVFALIHEVTGLPSEDIYLSCGEYDTWGVRGTLK